MGASVRYTRHLWSLSASLLNRNRFELDTLVPYSRISRISSRSLLKNVSCQGSWLGSVSYSGAPTGLCLLMHENEIKCRLQGRVWDAISFFLGERGVAFCYSDLLTNVQGTLQGHTISSKALMAYQLCVEFNTCLSSVGTELSVRRVARNAEMCTWCLNAYSDNFKVFSALGRSFMFNNSERAVISSKLQYMRAYRSQYRSRSPSNYWTFRFYPTMG